MTYGTDPAADVRASHVEEDSGHLRVAYEAPSGAATLELRLAGRFNVHNALAVVALGEALGLDPAAVRRGLASVELVPGRMERIELGQPFGVIVDYAHSPASLTTVLDLLAPVAASRGGGLIAVFGSAGRARYGQAPVDGPDRRRALPPGDRDRRGSPRRGPHRPSSSRSRAAPRPPGGGAATTCSSSPTAGPPSRRRSSGRGPGDIVLLAGKGHERSIIGPDGPQPWDERSEAEQALRRAGFG